MRLRDVPALLNPWSWAALAVGLAVVVFLVAYVLGAPQRAAQARQGGAVAQAQAKGSSENAKAAIDQIGRTQAGEAAVDRTTETNHDRIMQAEGAGQQVGAGVDLAGRCAVCLRKSAKGSASCQRLLDAGACRVAPRR